MRTEQSARLALSQPGIAAPLAPREPAREDAKPEAGSRPGTNRRNCPESAGRTGPPARQGTKKFWGGMECSVLTTPPLPNHTPAARSHLRSHPRSHPLPLAVLGHSHPLPLVGMALAPTIVRDRDS